MGKLGVMPRNATAVMVDIAGSDEGGGMVNGPEDRLHWDAINWRDQDKLVERSYSPGVRAGVSAGGSQAPVVKSSWSTSSLSRPHLVAVSR
jgi:hypothetical protein